MTARLGNTSFVGSDIVKHSSGEIVLTIETGISAGSISLLVNEQEIDFWIGEGNVSKSEDILQAIRNILYKNSIKIESTNLLAISGGPGSFTGLRIGAAIAKGLSKAFGCKIKAEPVLDAMIENDMKNKSFVAALPFGKNQVCWKLFEASSEDANRALQREEALIGNKEEFALIFQSLKADAFILHQNLYENLVGASSSNAIKEKKIINAGSNIAGYVGRKVSKKKNTDFNPIVSLYYINNL